MSAEEPEYGLVMPFVNVASKGGPYDDDAYCAGWHMGGLDARLEHRYLARVSETIRSDDRAQADLVAMKHGYSLRMAATDYMTANTDWMAQAECRDIPTPEIFFPRPSETADDAKAVCRRCPVRVDCLRDAFDKGDVYGYRGGMSGEARRKALVGRGRRPSQDEEIRRLTDLGWSVDAVRTALGVSKAVVYRAHSRRGGEAA